MPTINQLIREKKQSSGFEGMPAKAWCLYKGLYNNPEKTELRFA